MARHEGYLSIDHRAVSKGHFESATSTCSHCQRVVILNPDRTRPRHYCPQCDNYLCDECELQRTSTGYVHQSFEEFADKFLETAYKNTQTNYKELIQHG